jgi:hypothetical protein
MRAEGEIKKTEPYLESRWPVWEYCFVLLALLSMVALAIASFRGESPVFDEVAHIPSGLSYWQQHDTRLNVEHPPLLKMIAVIPLLFANIRADYTDSSFCMSGDWNCQWLFGRKFFEEWNRNRTKQIILLSRLPMLFLTLLLGWTIYAIARALAGTAGASLSLLVFVTSPFFLGYGPLVITDIGLCLFVLLCAWTGANLWLKRNTFSLAAFSLSAAAALLAKFSALLILPGLALFLLWMWWRPVTTSSLPSAKRGERHESHPVKGIGWVTTGLISAGVLSYVFYWLTCFRSSPLALARTRLASIEMFRGPERFLQLTSHFLTVHPHWERPLLPVWLYLTGIGYLNASLSRPAYLLGVHHAHGVWYYFPVVCFFKLAPGMLGLMLLLGCLVLLRRRHAGATPLLTASKRVRLRALLCICLVFVAAAIRSRLNIGIRHFSVPVSVGVVLISLLVPLVEQLFAVRSKRIVHATIAALVLSCVFTALAAFPHYISYYNWFRLETRKQEISTDSNLDWGQSLEWVANFVAVHDVQKIYADTLMMPLAPEVYIPGARPWRCDDPDPESPEWVVVSADFLLRQPPTCIGLMRYPHWSLANESMYVFRVIDDSYAKEAKRYSQEHPNLGVNVGVFK